jgi:hypothetical protein
MYTAKCSACGLEVEIDDKGQRHFDAAVFVAKCISLKLQVRPGDRARPLDERMATCPHLNASIRAAT